MHLFLKPQRQRLHNYAENKRKSAASPSVNKRRRPALRLKGGFYGTWTNGRTAAAVCKRSKPAEAAENAAGGARIRQTGAECFFFQIVLYFSACVGRKSRHSFSNDVHGTFQRSHAGDRCVHQRKSFERACRGFSGTKGFFTDYGADADPIWLSVCQQSRNTSKYNRDSYVWGDRHQSYSDQDHEQSERGGFSEL